MLRCPLILRMSGLLDVFDPVLGPEILAKAMQRENLWGSPADLPGLQSD